MHYNSNGSIWPSELIDHWKHFKNVDIHFSIDSIGKQFELERGGSWQDVESNILRIQNLNLPNLSFSIMPSISIMNVLYIDRVVDWATKHNFQIFASHVTSPSEFALTNLTDCAKQLILEKHQNNTWPEMQKILQLIKDLPHSNGKSFCKKMQWYDSIRNENFAETHFEIAQAMGYVYNNNL